MYNKFMIRLFLLISLLLSSLAHSTTITAKSWLVADGNGNILQSENINEIRSIASITKLMTVMVVLDAHQDLNEVIKPYTRKELIQLALVHSDNHAAEILCNNYVGGRNECIKAMNLKAEALQMPNTHYIEPTGLSVFNVSTATELVKLVLAAKDYPEIVQAGSSSQIKIKNRKKWFVFNNTNPIIGKKHKFIVSKTGDISDVTAENDPGYGTKAEAIRVITKGPKWKPAVQNGRNVIYRHKQSITFQVSEE
jgi:D-alanyl-D-alanine endopeptidase (penicillin-binding protein 7)